MTDKPITDDALLACPTPFCAVPEPYLARHGSLWKVKCKYCEVETEAQFTKALAVEQWSARTPPSDEMVEAVARIIDPQTFEVFRSAVDGQMVMALPSTQEAVRKKARAIVAAMQSRS